ncbi:H/ACA snoRNP pseudouridylase subunit [Chamberlinius hualienensis]
MSRGGFRGRGGGGGGGRGGYGGGGGGGYGGGGGGFRGGRGGGGFRGGRGGGGGRFGGRGDDVEPDEVVEFGQFLFPCQDQLVIKATMEKVPYFNSYVYLENKKPIGKIDEIFGPIKDYYISVNLVSDMKATSFTEKQTMYVDPNKLLPPEKFTGTGQRGGGGRGRGRGGRGGGGRGGGRGFGGRGGGGGRGFRGGGGGGGGGFRGGGYGNRHGGPPAKRARY